MLNIKSSQNESKRYIFYVFGFVCYRIVLDLCYFNIVATKYRYSGFQDSRSVKYFFLSWLIFSLYMLALRNIYMNFNVSIKNLIVFFLCIISFIPFTTMVYSGTFDDKFVVLNVIYTMLVIILSNFFDKVKFPKISFNINKKEYIDALLKFFIFISLAVVLYISFRYTGLRLNFDLDIVYDLRTEASEYDLPTVVEYLFSWTKVIDNILLIYCILERKKLYAILLFVTQMFSFGIDGSKTTFFMALLCVLLGFWRNIDTVIIKKWAPWLMTIFSFASWLEFKLFDSYHIVSLFLRRVLFMPVYIGSLYVDFFSVNTPDYFKKSFLRFFGFDTSYPNLTNIIGEIYFNSAEMSANNGLIADAITNFGTVGVFIMPLILVLLLKIIDSCSIGVDERICIYVAFIYAISFTNSFLFTILLTHGLFVAIFILLLLSNYGQTDNLNIPIRYNKKDDINVKE